MRELPEPEGQLAWQTYTRDQVLAIQKQAYEDGRLEAGKDAERLDHISINCRCDPKMDGNHVWWPTTWNNRLTGPTLRLAIDAAMLTASQKEQQ